MPGRDEASKLVQNTWLRFNSNMGALHALFENLTPSADQIDKAQIKQIASELAFIFKDKPEIAENDIAKYLPSVDDWDVYPDFRKDESVQEIILGFQDQELRDALLNWEVQKPYRAERFKRLFTSAFNNPPMNGVLVRRSMLVSLVTFFEIFLEDTYKNHDLALGLPKETAQKNAGKLMRGGWEKILKNLQTVDLEIPAVTKYFENVIEISQRRNLLVHNDGIVDENYKKHVPNRFEIGEHLLVSTRYFQKAIDIIHTLGFFLSYRQLEKYGEDKKKLYDKLDEFVLACLDQKRYSLVLELSDNSENLTLPENKQQIVMVNRAIAFRELGQKEEVEKIVTALKAVGSDWQIGMAISMLANDIPSLKRQIKSIPKSPNIVKILTWPLFDPVKNEIWFKTECLKKSRPKPQVNRKRRK